MIVFGCNYAGNVHSVCTVLVKTYIQRIHNIRVIHHIVSIVDVFPSVPENTLKVHILVVKGEHRIDNTDGNRMLAFH